MFTSLWRVRAHCISRLLIEYGADVGSLNLEHQTPVHSFYNPVLSRLLLCHWDSIDTDLQDDRGMTPAHYVTWTKQSTPADINPFLGDPSTFLNTRDIYGRTVLHLAAQRGNIMLVRTLLSRKDWSVEKVQDNAARTPLHYATENARVHVIDMLKDCGMNIDDLDIYGRTPFHHSAAEGTLAAIKHLIKTVDERKLVRKDNKGNNVLRLAVEHKNPQVADYLQAVHGMRLGEVTTPIRRKFYP